MQPIYAWSLLGTVIAVLSAACIFLGRLVLSQRHKLSTFNTARKQSIMDDLELATSDQLLEELRKRPGAPYLMLSPINGEDHQGLSIEVHNIPPVPCFHMLHLATTLTFRELKKRGVDLPDFPPAGSPEEGEEWKQE